MITSRANLKVKQFRKLRDRKERQKTGLFTIEGLRIVAEAVEQGAKIELLFVAPEFLVSEFGQQLVETVQSSGVDVIEVSGDVFHGLSLKDGPKGLAAVVRQRWSSLAEARLSPGINWTVLESIQNPGNLGTIMRTQDAVGAEGLILLDQSTDPYDPAAMRGSMGAIFTQQLVKTSFAEFADWKRQQGYPLIGTSDAAEVDYQAVTYPDPVLLMMGSERQGLKGQHVALCDEMVSIPMVGKNDSLNLAVATGLMLYEIFNQRRHNKANLINTL
ncbi:MAG: RNA methyltransferase [Anaerolineaceae bacterium]|nr:RNA methyltransferase [Anaerolineaceae bacterium]